MRKPMMPRDAAGQFEITEGTGPIRAMISTGELLEIFKLDKTFRVTTPETIDPARTNPNAPFTVSLVQNVGTSNPIVARVLLQGGFYAAGDKVPIRRQLHAIKELLLRAEACATQVRSKIEAIAESVRQDGIRLEQGRVFNSFPHVDNLEADCSTFLVEANRAIRAISGLPSLFIALERADNNFDHLGDRLAKAVGENQDLTNYVKEVAGGIARIIDLRNCLEHPGERRTIINNFQLLPDGKTLSPPTWHLSGETPEPVVEEMSAIIDFLICVVEVLLIHLVVYSGRKRFAFNVQQIPQDQMDRDFPVKYKILAYLKPFEKQEQPATEKSQS